MRLEETPEQQALRAELRAYFEQTLTPEVREGLAAHLEKRPPAFVAETQPNGATGGSR